MNSVSFSLALTVLMTSACSTTPVENVEIAATAEPHAASTRATFKYSGLLRYDGDGATLLGCNGEVYILNGKVFEGVIDEIKHLKADPQHKVWIQVTTTEEAKAEKEGATIPLETGELGRTDVDPCPAK